MQTERNLIRAIEARRARVAVVGAGYVGLAAAVQAGQTGFAVTAIDVDDERVRLLNQGRSYIQDIADHDLGPLVQQGRLQATTAFDPIAAADVVLICVPTPLTPNRVPDLTHVEAAAREVSARMHPGMLVSLESTTYPGTTEELLLPMLSGSGLTVGRDFFLTFCPERIDPGNPDGGPSRVTRILGGVTPACAAVGVAFYRQLSAGVTPISSPRIAEMAKLYENTYRAVNIALVNELTLLCDRMGLNIWEVLDAAATKPFGIQVFHPGPGVGGHCIPLDPHYLAWKAREYDFTLRFVELAGEINAIMPYFVVAKLCRLLNRHGRTLRGSNILILGVAYKKDVADARESPALRIIPLLLEMGAQVAYHDPLVPSLRLQRPSPTVLHSVPLRPGALPGYDAAVVVTDHSGVDYRAVVDRVPLVLDTRNVTAGLGVDPDRVWRL